MIRDIAARHFWGKKGRAEKMGKFKVGDKVLVEAEILEIKEALPGKYKVSSASFEYDPKSTLMPRHIYVDKVYSIPENTYEDGMSEAWRAATRIVDPKGHNGISTIELEQIFGTEYHNRYEHIFYDFTADEAAAKIKAWEDEKNFNVGDVVCVLGEKIGVVIKVWESGGRLILFADGTTDVHVDFQIKKMGQTIDIAEILKKLGEMKCSKKTKVEGE